jgi:DNA-binding YbaB/EbfC family protein
MPGIDMHTLMRQAKKLEKAMEEAKEKLAEVKVDGEAGGGLVKVHMNGKYLVERIEIDPKAMDPNDKAMLEDLLAAAVNAAVEKARVAAEASMNQATGGIRIPGLAF